MILVFPRRPGLKFHFSHTLFKETGNRLTADVGKIHMHRHKSESSYLSGGGRWEASQLQ